MCMSIKKEFNLFNVLDMFKKNNNEKMNATDFYLKGFFFVSPTYR